MARLVEPATRRRDLHAADHRSPRGYAAAQRRAPAQLRRRTGDRRRCRASALATAGNTLLLQRGAARARLADTPEPPASAIARPHRAAVRQSRSGLELADAQGRRTQSHEPVAGTHGAVPGKSRHGADPGAAPSTAVAAIAG